MASESEYIVHVNGRRCDITTREGADTFLKQFKGHPQGFISMYLPQACELRSLLAYKDHLGEAQRAEAVYRLLGVYHLFSFSVDRCTPKVFHKIVKECELSEFLSHGFGILQSISQTERWKETGALEESYDEELLDCLVVYSMQQKFCKVLCEDVNNDLLQLFAQMCKKEGRAELVSSRFAHYVLRFTNNLIESFKASGAAEKGFRLVDSSGLLIELLHVISLPQPDYHASSILLDRLQGCPQILRKRFCVGTPARQALDDVLAGTDGHPADCPEQVKVRLETIRRIADLATKPERKAEGGYDNRCCRACGKGGVELGADTKLLTCGKCRCTYYCSKECQVADWKSHKKTCSPHSKVSQTSEQTLTNYVMVRRYDILLALLSKSEELGGLAKNELILDLDFRPRVGASDSTAPALKGDFKVAVTKEYLNRTDAPAWFEDGADEESLKGVLKNVRDYYRRDLSNYILVLCRHASVGAGVFRLQLHSQTTMRSLFSDEVFSSLRSEDWDKIEELLGSEMMEELQVQKEMTGLFQ